MNGIDQEKEGWRQIQAGLELVQWSKLVQWDNNFLSLLAVDENVFESQKGHQAVHPTFGRLICWIAFSAGAEYLAKGACFLKGKDLSKPVSVTRIPSINENLKTWVHEVITKAPSAKENSVNFGTLGGIPLQLVLQDLSQGERDLAVAAFDLLRSTIRNRDAHRYAENVRAFHFHLVSRLFVPAFNAILRSLNQTQLRACVVTMGTNQD
ncbi:hypothetical protein [Nitrospira sp. Ecomares 2.1]